MAWRIEDGVDHGEIDNTIEGRTTGRIWLAGRDEPLILSLDGDCWRDLAGTRLEFENPSPKVIPEAKILDIDQSGIIGDMTASRKNRIPTVSEEEFHQLYQKNLSIPCEWHNTLYLEWFSEINGRVVIETTSYKLTIFPHEWHMDEDAEDAQKLANLNGMRDFMAQIIQRKESDSEEPESPGELDEYAWEERLKESDRLTDAYQEVLEKYMEDEDSEQKEAFVMGWDGLLEALADRDEAGEDFDEFDDFDILDSTPSGYEEEEEEDFLDPDSPSFEEEEEHPLQAKAQELAMRAMDLVVKDSGPETPEYQLISNLLQVSGKLAGALHGRNSGYEPEAGFVLAVLKRCLGWLHEAMAACQQLINVEKDADQIAALEHVRSTAFEIRDEIIEMRQRLK